MSELTVFTIRVKRTYCLEESTEVEIAAASPEEAISKAKVVEVDEGFDDWSEDDGHAATDSYEWQVIGDDGETLATGTGTYDV